MLEEEMRKIIEVAKKKWREERNKYLDSYDGIAFRPAKKECMKHIEKIIVTMKERSDEEVNKLSNTLRKLIKNMRLLRVSYELLCIQQAIFEAEEKFRKEKNKNN